MPPPPRSRLTSTDNQKPMTSMPLRSWLLPSGAILQNWKAVPSFTFHKKRSSSDPFYLSLFLKISADLEVVTLVWISTRSLISQPALTLPFYGLQLLFWRRPEPAMWGHPAIDAQLEAQIFGPSRESTHAEGDRLSPPERFHILIWHLAGKLRFLRRLFFKLRNVEQFGFAKAFRYWTSESEACSKSTGTFQLFFFFFDWARIWSFIKWMFVLLIVKHRGRANHKVSQPFN